jgi:SAM-dependent methyltransferase
MSTGRFSSTTHLHIYAIINTLIKYKFEPKKTLTIRILDVGCGNGVVLNTLIKELPARNPNIRFEFFGLDVTDSLVQKEGYFDKTISLLHSTAPDINWQNQLKLIVSKDRWPFPDDFFDLIFSNQVMEHVFDQVLLLSEIKRTMQYNGYSFHQYPLRHYIYEGHLLIPFVHKFSSWTTTYHWIRWASFLGIGSYKWHKKNGMDANISGYAERHADYLAFQVNYQTQKQITATAKQCGLKSSFDFTYLYYKQKIRRLFKLKPIEVYKETDIKSSKNSFYFLFLKYIEGITLVLRKGDTYRSGILNKEKAD